MTNLVLQQDMKSSGFLEDPFDQFLSWYRAAKSHDISLPQAMMLSTIEMDGATSRPTMRYVSMLEFNREGLYIVTNSNSHKAQQIRANPNVCLSFSWLPMSRAVYIQGVAAPLPHDKVMELFNSEDPTIQIIFDICGPNQSQVIESKAKIAERKAQMESSGRKVEVPSTVCGFLVKPIRFEFYQRNSDLISDRIVYTRLSAKPQQATIEHAVVVCVDGEKWMIQRWGP